MKRRGPLMPVGNPVSWKDIFVFFLPISAFRLYHVENQQGCVTEPFFIRLFTRSPGNRRILPECRFCALHVLFYGSHFMAWMKNGISVFCQTGWQGILFGYCSGLKPAKSGLVKSGWFPVFCFRKSAPLPEIGVLQAVKTGCQKETVFRIKNACERANWKKWRDLPEQGSGKKPEPRKKALERQSSGTGTDSKVLQQAFSGKLSGTLLFSCLIPCLSAALPRTPNVSPEALQGKPG